MLFQIKPSEYFGEFTNLCQLMPSLDIWVGLS